MSVAGATGGDGAPRPVLSRPARWRRAMFARHAHPCSAWSRWASTPLLLVPVWTRRWRHAAPVALWFALNPVLFAPPRHTSAWSTRAMLGEERWILDRPRDAALAVNVVGALALGAALLAARRRRPGAMIGATATAMAATLGYWALMARYHDRAASGPHR
ncbi:MAG TPA: DUF6653 family protein [Mycolicibacillus parakoreensis]|nr:DUF6653 family protein [Mycolicibacillus parakoreensis]HLR98055.1 DUF6653 family protein [Mycolicibacillus parakoreensis]